MEQMQPGMMGAGVKDESVSPIGDFIALVGGFAAALFAIALNWYTRAGQPPMKGVKAPVGVISFALGVGVFAFAVVMLVGRFINPDFRLMRSPGWVYGFAASVIFMVCIVGLVVTPKLGGQTSNINAGIILELLAASAIGVGGLLKF